ncbi:hypothetical protein P4U03_10185 [Bacillus mycoides]|uniref:Phage protein n=2 Tax=Bacillus cereus group TaxID=86661 RepID=A0A243ABT5_BACTU|nr:MULTISPECIES: hypothetical protein [Bacillus]MED1267004.1 hypothetical protein [Bacillus mycoides]MED1407256.1 hypothetical protein [Bacillus mycoides]OTY16201.1 hypothetical protein BK732_18195 [Bacillus thuringiensis serovar navarrensis]RAN71095.1 hypothetical protein B5P42_30715 [Bacillus sp. SRB_331]UNJ93059.1 hypothetical protein MN093_21545 [Bacillus mycoides]
MKELKDQLREWNRQSKQAKKKNKQKQKENLSTRDIEDLMGIRGPRYERRRGAKLYELDLGVAKRRICADDYFEFTDKTPPQEPPTNENTIQKEQQ